MGAAVRTDFLDLFKNDWFLLSDFTDFFLGSLLGEGHSRSVYELRMNEKHVVKIDRGRQFDNVSEWDVWNNVLHHQPEYIKFLAPCLAISSCGRILTQVRTRPVKLEDLPEEIPSFLSDTKLQNWGRIGKRVVCHDYANHRFYATADKSLIKAEWWSDQYQVK